MSLVTLHWTGRKEERKQRSRLVDPCMCLVQPTSWLPLQVGTYTELMSRGVDFHQFVKEEVDDKEKESGAAAVVVATHAVHTGESSFDREGGKAPRQPPMVVQTTQREGAEAPNGDAPGVANAGASATGGSASAAASSAGGTAEDFGGSWASATTTVNLGPLPSDPKMVSPHGDDADGRVRSELGGGNHQFEDPTPGASGPSLSLSAASPLSLYKPSRFGGGSVLRLGSSMRQRGLGHMSSEAMYEVERRKLLDMMAQKEKDGKLITVGGRMDERYSSLLSLLGV